MYQRDRETEGDKDRLSHWPIFSSSSLEHITLCYLQGLTSLLLLLPGQGPLWVVVPLGTRWPSFCDWPCRNPRPPDWRLASPRLPISAVGRVYIISQRPLFRLLPTWYASTYLHRCILQSPCLHRRNIRQHVWSPRLCINLCARGVPYVCPLSFRRGICCLLYNYSAGVSRWFLHFPPPHPARWGSFPENYTFVAPCNTFTRWHLYSTTSRNHLILLS